MKHHIQTPHAPAAIGPYSQAIRCKDVVYFSGQIPLDPKTMALISDDFAIQAEQVLINLKLLCEAAGGSLDAIVKLTIYLTDLTHFPLVNVLMARFFNEPYPARTTVQVSALPKAAQIEIDAVMIV